MVNTDEPWPFRGRVVWLTAEQGGRRSGPPSAGRPYAHNAFVPPQTIDGELNSFVLDRFDPTALTSTAEGQWLVVENSGDQLVVPGTVVVCTEGPRVVAYFHVDEVIPPSPS